MHTLHYNILYRFHCPTLKMYPCRLSKNCHTSRSTTGNQENTMCMFYHCMGMSVQDNLKHIDPLKNIDPIYNWSSTRSQRGQWSTHHIAHWSSGLLGMDKCRWIWCRMWVGMMIVWCRIAELWMWLSLMWIPHIPCWYSCYIWYLIGHNPTPHCRNCT